MSKVRYNVPNPNYNEGDRYESPRVNAVGEQNETTAHIYDGTTVPVKDEKGDILPGVIQFNNPEQNNIS